MEIAPHSPPGAVVFDTSPIPFAVRAPVTDLKDREALGEGIAIWFGCDDADALHEHLVQNDTPIVSRRRTGRSAVTSRSATRSATITPHTVRQG